MTTVSTDFEHFFQNSRDLLCIAGTDAYFKVLNPTWSKLLGWSEAELTAVPFTDFIFEEDLPSTFAEVEKLSQGEPTIYFENRYRTKDGSFVWLAWTAAPFEDGTIYASARDVTTIKALEAELRANNEELSRSNQELDQFAYIVSHDLKAPLRAINSLVEFISEDISEGKLDEIESHAIMLKGRVARMGTLIEDILAYSKIGRQKIHPEKINPEKLIREVIESLDPPAGIRINIQSPMPEILGSRIRLQQTFSNLIGNAIKYMGKPSGKIDVSFENQGDFLEFRVVDDGPGIDPSYHEKIFGMFQRLEIRSDIEGTGIGLPMVKKIVEEMNGTIRIESKPGEGATFIFTWPKCI